MTVAGRPAVFLDRDGVLNDNVFYADTGETEAPRGVADFRLKPRAMDAARALQDAGFVLFIVSNQPNQAKRKALASDHDAIHAALMAGFAEAGVTITEAYYCFHHPSGIEPSLAGPCDCRKPSPYFLLKARDAFDIDLANSWMVGDRHTDIGCATAAGVRGIFIGNDPPADAAARADDLWQASRIILAAA